MAYDVKKIMVPLDLSETSLNAFRTAAFLAARWNATLIIINVNEDIFGITNRKQLHSPHYANPDVLSALISTLKQNNINSRLIQTDGTVVESIISNTIKEKADLVIMGAHGASGMREGFIGTNAYNVIKYSTCPVLAIPARVKPQSFKKVLYPILPVPDAFASYEIVCKFLDANSTLSVFGLSSLKIERKTKVLDDIVEKIKPQLDSDKVKVETSWANGGTISDEILSYSKLILPDMIVLTSMIDTIYKPDFTGPHTQKIINNSRIPVLCIK